jgi:hypothetical protein
MTKIRLTQLGCLALLIAWYIGSAMPASATPDPPPGYYASPAAQLPADPPAQPAVVHDHIAPEGVLIVADRRRHADRRRNDRPPAPSICPAR